MIPLAQSGRAGLQLMGSLQRYSSTVLAERAKHAFYDANGFPEKIIGDRPSEEMEATLERAIEHANSIQAHRFNRLYQRIVAEAVYDRGIPAAEARRDAAQEMLQPTPATEKTGKLTLNPDLQMPDYYEGVEWHLMPGGWDGYDLAMLMFMSGVVPYIFRHGGYAAVEVDADIYGQRTGVLDQLPKATYGRIYEAGSGGTPTLGMLRRKFPDAELVGADLSGAMQRGGHEMDKKKGLGVHLKQEDCRQTSEPDKHYDAVVCYALFHETPDDVCADILKEMLRIMAPGADIIISDPPPLRALTPYAAVISDWETDNREEPWFGASTRRNLPEILSSIGYENAQDYALGDGSYPWVTRANKPEH
ncbi:MAG: SAM-dependent methyltransferase [Halieaceae bacterium]|jgi:SAM-dependent methyltransferase